MRIFYLSKFMIGLESEHKVWYNNIVMNKQILKKSVILLGPAGVGKSYLSDKLRDKDLKGYEVISTDILYSLAILNYQGSFKNFEEFENNIRLITRHTRVSPELPNYAERLERHEKDADRYFAMIKRYRQLIDFDQLSDYLELLSYINQFKGTKDFSEEGFEYLRSLLFARMIECALDSVKVPVILDAGANFGSDITATNIEKYKYRQLMNPDYNLDSYMTRFVQNFGVRIYLDPGKSYRQNPYSRQRLPRLHYKNGRTYKSNATDTIDVSRFYNGYNEELFNAQRRVLDTDIDLIRESFINQAEVDRLVEELYLTIMNKIKTFE